jgi:hypothetical protein
MWCCPEEWGGITDIIFLTLTILNNILDLAKIGYLYKYNYKINYGNLKK